MTLFRTASHAHPDFDPFGAVPAGWYIFQLRAMNACGASEWYETEIEYVDCSQPGNDNPEYPFTITASPNPVVGNLNVKLENEKPEVKALSKNEKVSYMLYDVNRTKAVKQWTFDNSQPQRTLNVHGIMPGQYILIVAKGKYRRSTKIFIQ